MDSKMKNNLLNNITNCQRKLVKIIKVEQKLSQQHPPKKQRLKKVSEARYKVMNDINIMAHLLVNMGESFKIAPRKKIKKSSQ